MSGAMDLIAASAEIYADARNELADEVAKLEDEIAAAKRRHLSKIRTLFDAMAAAKTSLRSDLEAHPELFEKPRTVVLSGIKVGFAKARGTIEFSDEARVIRLIREKFEDQADSVVQIKESILKSALALWPAGDLKRIGVNVIADTDEVVIKPVDGEIEKLLKTLEADLDKEMSQE